MFSGHGATMPPGEMFYVNSFGQPGPLPVTFLKTRDDLAKEWSALEKKRLDAILNPPAEYNTDLRGKKHHLTPNTKNQVVINDLELVKSKKGKEVSRHKGKILYMVDKNDLVKEPNSWSMYPVYTWDEQKKLFYFPTKQILLGVNTKEDIEIVSKYARENGVIQDTEREGNPLIMTFDVMDTSPFITIHEAARHFAAFKNVKWCEPNAVSQGGR
jgi:hypothetical protein